MMGNGQFRSPHDIWRGGDLYRLLPFLVVLQWKPRIYTFYAFILFALVLSAYSISRSIDSDCSWNGLFYTLK